MKRTQFIQTLTLSGIITVFVPCLLTGQENKSNTDKPNILFIITDQQAHNMMSCTGNRYLNTPNLDKLASMGVRFEMNYSVCPVCSPTRFSLMTGHYPSEVGIKENPRTVRPARFDSFEDKVQSTYEFDLPKLEEIKKEAWGNIFRRAGYETFYSGKRHLWGKFSGYGFTSKGQDPFDGPAIYAENTFAEMAKSKPEKPFLMYLSFMEPHGICYQQLETNEIPESQVRFIKQYRELHKTMRRENYLSQIPPRKTSRPIGDEHPDMFSFISHYRHWDQEWDMYNWIYHRLTETADKQIGRVLYALEKSGLQDNTIIIFTSDHGDMQGAHGLVWKNVLLEECQRVPFIFAGPGIKQNIVDKTTLVCNGLDLLPTVCDLAGIDIPKGLKGISLKPYLTGEGTKPEREYLITECFNAFQITDGRYKYTIYELPGHPETLTDILINPDETINYANDAEYKKIKEYYKKELMADLTNRGLAPLAEDRQIEYVWPTRTTSTLPFYEN